MTIVQQIIRHILEAEGETITLGDLFIDHRPEQWVWDMFSNAELDVPLPIKEVDPNKLLAHGNPLEELVHVAEMPVHMSLIKAYRKNPEGPILIDGPNILDGHHRAMAAFLEKRKVRAVDIRDWPVTEAFEDDEINWKDVVGGPTLEQLKREYVIRIYDGEDDDPRTTVQNFLVQLGVEKRQAMLAALEWGSSQAYVTKAYLREIGVHGQVLEDAAKFIAFTYLLQRREGLLQKLYFQYTEQ